MTDWMAKRFWTDVVVEDIAGRYRVLLDMRPLNTPGKLPLILPTRAMAEAIAGEWRAQDGQICPLTMPCTRSANSAIERVTPQHSEVAGILAAYGKTDLLCYRAEGPGELTQRQADAWDPLLQWAEETYGARLRPTAGILPVEQDRAGLDRLAREIHDIPAFPLTAMHDLVTLTGSLILGLAVSAGRLTAKEAWKKSRIDEDWQIVQWGEDEEATQAAAARETQLRHAESFWSLCFAR